MVRIITPEKERDEKHGSLVRVSKLVEMTTKCLPETEASTFPGSYDMTVRKKDDRWNLLLSVDFERNRISVELRENLKYAIQIAEAYENSGEPEFTVIRNY